MILLKTCVVCNQKKFRKKMDCVDFSLSNEVFSIVSCETCGFVFTNPRPKNDALGEYYKSENYISHTNKSQGLFNWLYQKIRIYTIKRKVSLLKKFVEKKTHLDIGCGTGEFLNACKNEGFLVKGVEPSKKAREQAINNFALEVSKETDLSCFEKRSVCSISMWHVLEHIPDIHTLLGSCSEILEKNGVIFVAVPNHKSWDASFYKEYWAAWDVPIHLWHFSKRTITLLFKNYGFNLVKTKPMFFDSFYVSLLSEEFKYGKKNFVKAFFVGLISNVLGLITKRSLSSTIYVFKKDS